MDFVAAINFGLTELKNVFKRLDIDNDNRITFNEFKRLASINLEYNYLDSIVNSLNEISNKNTEIRLLGNELSNNEKNNIINTIHLIVLAITFILSLLNFNVTIYLLPIIILELLILL